VAGGGLQPDQAALLDRLPEPDGVRGTAEDDPQQQRPKQVEGVRETGAGSRSRWQSCHRRANLGCQAANAGPTGAARLSWRAACGRGDRGYPNAFRAVRPFPVRVASGSPWRAGWSGRCPDGYDRAGGVRAPVRSWRPWWTPDTTARTSDRDQACGRSGIQHGCRCHDGRVPMLGAAGVAEASMRIAVLFCPVRGRDVQAAWVAVASCPDAWSDAGRWRCPPPSGRGPYPPAGRSHGTGMSGRPDA
jgi:hypothetical protein